MLNQGGEYALGEMRRGQEMVALWPGTMKLLAGHLACNIGAVPVLIARIVPNCSPLDFLGHGSAVESCERR